MIRCAADRGSLPVDANEGMEHPPRAAHESPPTPRMATARSDWAQATTVYRSWELLEVSRREIPGNSNTITTEVLRSLAVTTVNQSLARARK